ncbi:MULTISPECIES: hypothetical protein [Streptomyces]|uniref:hypothetical protein n=1 Tax=Streptomyces TaxID=1883 RepID=UPI0007C536CB|nr:MULTISPECIES: hypothetical protein [Streptomyces]MDP9951537.1 hypothetical protein [Streptomyces sp. DSM 41269]
MSPTEPDLIRAEFDLCRPIPSLVDLRTAVRGNDWDTVEAYFDFLGDDEDERAVAAGLVADLSSSERFLEREVAAHGSPLARTLLAARYIDVGWDIRSAYTAEHVSREQFQQFHGWLRRAEQLLIGVCADEPSYALAWSYRLTTARGLELGASEARRRYDRLAEHHPHHIQAQILLLQQLCPKWGGRWEETFGFARGCLDAAPAGSHAGRLVAQAHLERWMDDSDDRPSGYLRSAEVRDEILAAADRSVRHPDYRPGFHWVGDHNGFAGALSLGGHYREAAPYFRTLGDKATELPWGYWGDREVQFLKHRRRALAKG